MQNNQAERILDYVKSILRDENATKEQREGAAYDIEQLQEFWLPKVTERKWGHFRGYME